MDDWWYGGDLTAEVAEVCAEFYSFFYSPFRGLGGLRYQAITKVIILL
jgi:hypothetical protein